MIIAKHVRTFTPSEGTHQTKIDRILLAQKQPDIPTHGFLVAIEITHEQIEFSIVVPVGDTRDKVSYRDINRLSGGRSTFVTDSGWLRSRPGAAINARTTVSERTAVWWVAGITIPSSFPDTLHSD